jgi:hypothetical protein
MADTLLRATMESGATWDDPSEDLLYELVSEIERGDEKFMVIERLRDPTRQTYAQCVKQDNGSFLVERRDGGLNAHFRYVADSSRQARDIVMSWAFELPGWDSALAWEPVNV